MSSSVSGLLTFFMHLGQCKRVYRSGWYMRGLKEPESIADHMYRMSLMAFTAPSHLNRQKLLLYRI
jgi:putative hydrolases of HD superfamily